MARPQLWALWASLPGSGHAHRSSDPMSRHPLAHTRCHGIPQARGLPGLACNQSEVLDNSSRLHPSQDCPRCPSPPPVASESSFGSTYLFLPQNPVLEPLPTRTTGWLFCTCSTAAGSDCIPRTWPLLASMWLNKPFLFNNETKRTFQPPVFLLRSSLCCLIHMRRDRIERCLVGPLV